MMMAFNGLPYTALNLIPVFYSPQQVFNSGAKELKRREGQNNRRVGAQQKQQTKGEREKGRTNE
jgi:hypothetical protein